MEEYILTKVEGVNDCWCNFIRYFLEKSVEGVIPQDAAEEYLKSFNATITTDLDDDPKFIFRFETAADMTRFMMTWS